MFTYLYTSVIPVMGDFFGKLVIFATMPFNEFIHVLRFGDIVYYTNLFTGTLERLIFYRGFGTKLIAQLFQIITIGIDTSQPVWVVFLVSITTIYAVIALFRFILP